MITLEISVATHDLEVAHCMLRYLNMRKVRCKNKWTMVHDVPTVLPFPRNGSLQFQCKTTIESATIDINILQYIIQKDEAKFWSIALGENPILTFNSELATGGWRVIHV